MLVSVAGIKTKQTCKQCVGALASGGCQNTRRLASGVTGELVTEKRLPPEHLSQLLWLPTPHPPPVHLEACIKCCGLYCGINPWS